MNDHEAFERLLRVDSQQPVAAVLRLLVELGLSVCGGDEGSLLLLDPSADSLVFAAVVGSASSELVGQSVPVGSGLTGLAAVTGQVQLGAPTFALGGAARDGHSPRSVIAAPMMLAEQCVGVITAVAFDSAKRFTEAHVRLYAQLATVGAVLIGQQRALAVTETADPETLSAQRSIAQSISRLTSQKPEQIASLAAMLRALEALSLGDAR
ncbi:MAG: GAF domain-containing protein [Deltaproteobacteria bacterium]|nr:GAF domain-containing protein [Deltaproteobacteria bacterium]